MSGRQTTCSKMGYGVLLALASFSSSHANSNAFLLDEDPTGQRLQAPPLSKLSQLGGRYIPDGDISYKVHAPKYLGSNVHSFAVSPDGEQIAFFSIKSESTKPINGKNLNKFSPNFSVAQTMSGARKDFPLPAIQSPVFFVPEEQFINNYVWINNGTLLVDTNEQIADASGMVKEKRVAYAYSSSSKTFTPLPVSLYEDSEIYLSKSGRTNSAVLNWNQSGAVSVTVLGPQLNVIGNPIEIELGWTPAKKLQGETLIFWRDADGSGKASEWLELNLSTGKKSILTERPVSHESANTFTNSQTHMSLIERPLPVDEGVSSLNSLYLSLQGKEFYIDSSSRVSHFQSAQKDNFIYTITDTGDLKLFRLESRPTVQVKAEQARYMFFEEAAAKLRALGANLSELNDAKVFPTNEQISDILKEREGFADLKSGKATMKVLLNEIPGGLEIMSLTLNGNSARLVCVNGRYDVVFSTE